jgi:hypothetical protein
LGYAKPGVVVHRLTAGAGFGGVDGRALFCGYANAGVVFGGAAVGAGARDAPMAAANLAKRRLIAIARFISSIVFIFHS